jgi:hypothetical protein
VLQLFSRVNSLVAAEDSGDESEEEEERRDEDRNEEDETDESGDPDSPVAERAPSPEEEVVLSASNSHQEHLGPTEEEDADFAKELAKMVTDISAESRKVDKKTALALWDNATLPPVVRKKRADVHQEPNGNEDGDGTMAFTLITKRGNKQSVCLKNIFVELVLTGTLFRPVRSLCLRHRLWLCIRFLPNCRIRSNNNISSA